MLDLLRIDDCWPRREHIQPYVSFNFDRGHRIAKLMSLEAAIKQVETDLRTTSGKISLSLSIFILFLGSMPLLWAAIGEIKGRKVRVYFIRYLFCLPKRFLNI